MNYEFKQEISKIKESNDELARTLENRLEDVSKENRRLDSEKVEQLRQWREESAQMQMRFEHDIERTAQHRTAGCAQTRNRQHAAEDRRTGLRTEGPGEL